MNDRAPLVGILMGSQSDWETMKHAASTLAELGVANEAHIISAHRKPKRLTEYVTGARERGLRVLARGGGGADVAAGVRRADGERRAQRHG